MTTATLNKTSEAILRQLGGKSHLRAAAGVTEFWGNTCDRGSLVMSMRGPKVNVVAITLTGRDTYAIRFAKNKRITKSLTVAVTVAAFEDVLVEDLAEVFKDVTGIKI